MTVADDGNQSSSGASTPTTAATPRHDKDRLLKLKHLSKSLKMANNHAVDVPQSSTHDQAEMGSTTESGTAVVSLESSPSRWTVFFSSVRNGSFFSSGNGASNGTTSTAVVSPRLVVVDADGGAAECEYEARAWTPSAVRRKIRDHPAWTFCVAICLLILVHGALTSAYITAVITTIEKRFELRSSTSGLIISSYEFGSLVSVLFVSYYGSNGHIPRYLGIGALLLCIGSLLFSLPHFIANPPTLNDTLGYKAPGAMPRTCDLSGNESALAATTTPATPIIPKTDPKCLIDGKASSGQYVVVLIFGQILLGIGGSPIFTLGTTYIDNHVSKEKSSVYLACMYVMVAVGPVCGFGLGALMLSQYVAPPEPAELPDQAVIGLWWGGFILLGILYLFAALPFFGFPKRLPMSENNEQQETNGIKNTVAVYENGSNTLKPDISPSRNTTTIPRNDSNTSQGVDPATPSEDTNSIKKIPMSFIRLISNSVYMCASLLACMDLAIVSGFTTYLPKYFETQFGFSKSIASAVMGSVAVPGAIMGISLGSFLIKRYNLKLSAVSAMIVAFNAIALTMVVFFLFLGCPNLDLAGIFSTYNELDPFPNPLRKSVVNLTDPCNAECHCSPNIYEPVCGNDGKTYFSPCFAGCTEKIVVDNPNVESIAGIVSRKSVKYTTCQCVPANSTAITYPLANVSNQVHKVTAVLGECDSACKMLVPFLLLLFFLTLVASTNQMPLIMVTLRAVSEEEKAFALGLQVVMLRLFAYIPAPIVFGSVIDTTCLVWKPTQCQTQGTTCLLYDIEQFRLRYGLVAIAYKLCAVLMSVILYWRISRRRQGAEPFSAPITMGEIAHRMAEWENLHLRNDQYYRGRYLRSWVSDDSLYSRTQPHPHQHYVKTHHKTLSC